MTYFKDFTFADNRYPLDQMVKLMDTSTPSGVHWVPIIDIGVSVYSDAGRKGLELDLFIKSNKT